MTAPLVLIEHLVKSYRRGDQVVEVLRDISLAIPSGAFTALMGPSGSGKSTPLSGLSMPAIRLSSVLLPEPEGPISAVKAPDGIARLISRSTSTT